MSVRGAWVCMAAFVGVAGCREIIGVPGETDLRSLDAPPPLCECSPLTQQGPEFAEACRAAYARLPAFGAGTDESTFASKEDMLGSSCGVCQEGDEAFVVDCYTKLLASVDAGAGVPGAPCESHTDCGGFACCAGAVVSGEVVEAAGKCCPNDEATQTSVGCLACLTALLPGAAPEGEICAGSFVIAAAAIECMCEQLPETRGIKCPVACYGAGGNRQCVSAACWECMAEDESIADACPEEIDACVADEPRPFR